MKRYIVLSLSVLSLIGCGSVEENPAPLPEVVNDTVTIVDGNSTKIDVLANDMIDDRTSAKVVLVTPPKEGNATVVDNTVTYMPSASFSGKDSFTYCVETRDTTCSKEAQVLITVEQPLEKRVMREVLRDPKNWYMQFYAKNLDNAQLYRGAKVGELDKGTTTKNYSLKAFSGSGYPYIKITTVDADGEIAGNFTTFYRPYTETENEKRWRFKVEVSQADALVELGWQGLYVLTPYVDRTGRERFKENIVLQHPLLKRMKLIDTESGEEVSTIYNGYLQKYRFSMDGERVRWFEWVLESEDVVPSTQKVLFKIEKKSQFSKVQKSTFDPRKPPIFGLKHE